MTSPFPGMDPYLEGSMWRDVHHELASQIRKQLVPAISPKYVARIEPYVVKDNNPKSEFGTMYPDVDISLRRDNNQVQEPALAYRNGKPPTPIDFSISTPIPIEWRIPVIQIRDSESNELITSIEILSPVNKRKPGLEAYLAKKEKLRQAGINLLEIDLLRRGTRSVQDPRLADTDYMAALTYGETGQTDIWKIQLQSPLPVLPVPLAEPDDPVSIDVQEALTVIYEEAAYHLSIRYKGEIPPPALSEGNQNWMKGILQETLGI